MKTIVNKNFIGSLFFLVALFVFYKHLNRRSYKALVRDCEIESKRKLEGRVVNFYMDNDINVKAFIVEFSNGFKYKNPIFLKGLNGQIQIGDSIYKSPGAFKFEIYDKNKDSARIYEEVIDCSGLDTATK